MLALELFIWVWTSGFSFSGTFFVICEGRSTVFGAGQLCCYRVLAVLTVTLLVSLGEVLWGFSLGNLATHLHSMNCSWPCCGLNLECLLWACMLNYWSLVSSVWRESRKLRRRRLLGRSRLQEDGLWRLSDPRSGPFYVSAPVPVHHEDDELWN